VSQTLTPAELLSPAPILEAVERYRGTIVDLDASRALSGEEFARAREALTAALAGAGLAPGDRVIVAIPNGPLFLAVLAAVLTCEGSPLLLHFRTPPAEVRRYAQRFGVRFFAFDPTEEVDFGDLIAISLDHDFAGLATLRFAALDVPDAFTGGPTLRGVPLHPTSGSTGLPKIALRPGFAAIEEARHYAATLAIDEDDTIMAIPPMSHAYGYGMCAMVPLLTGANLVTTRKFSDSLIHRALAEHPVTIVPTVPAMLDVLSFGRGADLRRARWVLTAGAMLPLRAAELFRKKTGVTACPLYGTTETGGISVAIAADGNDVDGRVGPPMAGVGVKVGPSERTGNQTADAADPIDGLERLFVRSSSMMAGYLDDTGQILPVADGWFETGDLARIEEGAIVLRGRDSEVINVFGLKVVPCEVEEAITTLPGVVEVRVYAGEHRSGTQVVKAAVAVSNELTAADVRAHCEQSLVYYKRPQVVTLVERLPRTPTGKIDRERLP
jgi:acyl-CoA synthetase (AMP-forming)/AMP-acid ligase II